MTKWEETEEYKTLSALYEELHEDECFCIELNVGAAVGDMRDLRVLAKDWGCELDEAAAKLSEHMGALVDITVPGTGDTREERIRKAWETLRQLRDETQAFPRLIDARQELGLDSGDPKPLGTF